MRKNTFLLVLVVLLLVSTMSGILSADGYGADCEADGIGALRAPACDFCGSVMRLASVKPGSWLFVSAKACPEYYQCIIREYQREVDYYYECPNCGYSLRNTNIEYKEEHSIVH